AHDDLPAMDDDDLRRGRPTLHRAFDEAMAILAGDAMTVLAFRALCADEIDPALAGRLCRELADASAGMIVGQVYDTLGGMPESLAPAERVSLIHRCKTGALLRASCRMGAIVGLCAKAPSEGVGRALADPSLASLTAFGTAVGLMYQ